ncbi:RpiR family transcriptional regulator [Mangrovibacter sp. MFB070]|uniref:MurR/RpiR family transcriptional regulator n=1 Tax=Mangrovibacter sp. MFB070 TaxID=1224318 RepID=UPI0004D3F980|nr:MurR/RpiR family transcriptional regulator [Mangrovibacter sp. MFB070]KEA52911.1 RpiR family transcriptional regulator [Mangrovibacter sp. MFB070]
MEQAEIIAKLKTLYEQLPRQERQAANFVLDNPQEVAVMSMREQSRQAGVPPSTMTRLAKRVGFTGYDDLRAVFIATIRGKDNEYESRVPGLVAMNKQGEASLLRNLAGTTMLHIESLCQQENLESITRAGKLLADARNIYCLGMRSSFPVVFHFHHVSSWFASNVRLIEGAGESGMMTLLHDIGPKDVLLVVSLAPYSRRAVVLTRHLAQQKIRIVAITDNASSPVARLASETILVKKKTTSFFDTITPALLVCELLVALFAANARVDIQSCVKNTEEQLWATGEWWGLN